MVKLSGYQIDQIIPLDRKAGTLKGADIRIEIIPEDQIDIPEGDFLLKCAFSRNKVYPPNGCILTPFYIRVYNGEDFSLTRCRLLSLTEPQLGELSFILYDGYRRYLLDDQFVLSQLNSNLLALYMVVDIAQLNLNYFSSPLKIKN